MLRRTVTIHPPTTNTQYAQFHQKLFRPGFLRSRTQRESKGSPSSNASAWTHTFRHAHLHISPIYAYMYTTLSICKTPHLVQTGQARLMRFLCIPRLDHIPKDHNQCFGACGSESNLHGTGAICCCGRYTFSCPIQYNCHSCRHNAMHANMHC